VLSQVEHPRGTPSPLAHSAVRRVLGDPLGWWAVVTLQLRVQSCTTITAFPSRFGPTWVVRLFRYGLVQYRGCRLCFTCYVCPVQAIAGLPADGRQVVNRALAEARNYKRFVPLANPRLVQRFMAMLTCSQE
jgi:hypothetical protein